MSNNDNNNRRRYRESQYSTINASISEQNRQELITKRRNLNIIIGLILVIVFLSVGLYTYFNFDTIINLGNDINEQVILTPTPAPTAIPKPTPKSTSTPTPVPDITPAPVVTSTPKPPVIEFTISVVGDLTFHQPQLIDAYDSETGTYDFSHNFIAIAPYLEESDLVLANLNTVMAGEKIGYSGELSNLNTPESALEAIKGAGIDVLMTANENVFRQGWIGVQYTNNYIRKAGLISTGTYLSEVEYYRPMIVDVEGVKIAILNYVNKRASDEIEQMIPENQAAYATKILKMSAVNRDVELCKDAGADLIFAYVNWGEKTSLNPTRDISDYASAMTEAGIDCIFGAYPEVLQPIVVKSLKRSANKPSSGVLAYSMGSLITSRRSAYLDSSAILNITYTYNTVEGNINLSDVNYVPTYISTQEIEGVDYEFEVVPVGKYLDNQSLYDTLSGTGKERLEQVWAEIVSLLGEGLVYPVR